MVEQLLCIQTVPGLIPGIFREVWKTCLKSCRFSVSQCGQYWIRWASDGTQSEAASYVPMYMDGSGNKAKVFVLLYLISF